MSKDLKDGGEKPYGFGEQNGVLGSGYSKCKGPEVGVCLGDWWAGAEQVKGRRDPRRKRSIKVGD